MQNAMVGGGGGRWGQKWRVRGKNEKGERKREENYIRNEGKCIFLGYKLQKISQRGLPTPPADGKKTNLKSEKRGVGKWSKCTIYIPKNIFSRAWRDGSMITSRALKNFWPRNNIHLFKVLLITNVGTITFPLLDYWKVKTKIGNWRIIVSP